MWSLQLNQVTARGRACRKTPELGTHDVVRFVINHFVQFSSSPPR